MKKKPLKRLTINEELYNNILSSYSSLIEYKADLSDLVCGHKKKNIIYYNNTTIICNKIKLILLGVQETEEISAVDIWYQFVLDKKVEQVEPIADSVNPVQAVNMVNKKIYKRYTKNERNEIFSKHEKDNSDIHHYILNVEAHKIFKFENCYYYDANGAYASELIKMFPLCRDDFTYMFEHRHDNNNKYKNIFNYFVGCLTENEDKRQYKIAHNMKLREIFPKTRHYIVQNVSDKLVQLLKDLKGTHIYVNTDGAIIQNVQNVIPTSKEVGAFKIEYQGDVYFYRDDNYYIYQFGDEIKGNLPLELRKYVDLRENRIVKFDRVLNKETNQYEYKNIKEINICQEQ